MGRAGVSHRPTGAAVRGPRSACRVHCLSCEDFSSGPFRSTVEYSRRSACGDSESDALAARFGVSGVVRQALTGCSRLFTATDAGVCGGGSSHWPANTRGVPVSPPPVPVPRRWAAVLQWRPCRRRFVLSLATGVVAWLVAVVLRRRGVECAPRGFVVRDTPLYIGSSSLCVGDRGGRPTGSRVR